MAVGRTVLRDIDPNMVVGAVVIGNDYNRYGITSLGTMWMIYKVFDRGLLPLYEVDQYERDILIGPYDIAQFEIWRDDLENKVSSTFPVHSGRFDFVKMHDRFTATNKDFRHLLKKD